MVVVVVVCVIVVVDVLPTQTPHKRGQSLTYLSLSGQSVGDRKEHLSSSFSVSSLQRRIPPRSSTYGGFVVVWVERGGVDVVFLRAGQCKTIRGFVVSTTLTYRVAFCLLPLLSATLYLRAVQFHPHGWSIRFRLAPRTC